MKKESSPREVMASVSQYESRKLEQGDILIEKSGGGPNQPVGRAVFFDIEPSENNTFSTFTTRLRLAENYIDKITYSKVSTDNYDDPNLYKKISSLIKNENYFVVSKFKLSSL